METRKKRVVVALSGGVDSSVSAALLQKEGYAVEGAFIVTWTAPWLPCTWRAERLDAMRVAAHLRIPFHTVDLSETYERDVVQYLVREYTAGRTPNPDVMCNKYVKFGGFLDWALAHGFDAIATGHYVRRGVECEEDGVPRQKSSTGDTDQVETTCPAHLFSGVDTAKDQSYFLWTLTQAQLQRSLFPVGGFVKPAVREMARAYGLPTMAKKDSQGICFLGKVDMREFLSHYVSSESGRVLDESGVTIGHHDGAVFFTLGQRHGFTITHTTPDTRPQYVIAKDMRENTITVAPRSQILPASVSHPQQVTLTECNWISGSPEVGGRGLMARFRYRQALFPVTILSANASEATVQFASFQPYVPEGQSLVCYRGEQCLGGGIIDTVTAPHVTIPTPQE